MSLSRRSIKKVTPKELDRLKSKKYRLPKSLECGCGNIVENVGHDIGSVECWLCVAKQVAPPHNYKRAGEDDEKKPRGWHFMEEYVSPSGKVYHKGRLVNEPSESDGKGVSGDVVRSDAKATDAVDGRKPLEAANKESSGSSPKSTRRK